MFPAEQKQKSKVHMAKQERIEITEQEKERENGGREIQGGEFTNASDNCAQILYGNQCKGHNSSTGVTELSC